MLQPIQGLTEELYTQRFKDFMRLYIGKGRPANDTIDSYSEAVIQLLAYLQKEDVSPLKATELHLLQFREHLYMQGYRQSTIKLRLAGIRAFYKTAQKLGLIEKNPAQDISGNGRESQSIASKYLTESQLQHLLTVAHEEKNEFVRARNALLIILMGVEGLRVVEAHRMSVEDIDFATRTIYIHGKGHDDLIFPSDTTFLHLDTYLSLCHLAKRDRQGTPMFFSLSHRCVGARMTRAGIRCVINELLEKIGVKKVGFSCHLLRHTCGTLLYAKTKDLMAVKETLRHRDVKMTARYAHLQDRMKNRYTSMIDIGDIEK